MRRLTISLSAGLLLLNGSALTSTLEASAPSNRTTQPALSIAAAVANPARDPDNVKLDVSRKPAEMLKFFGLKPGMRVLDLFGGNRYWAEIIAPIVGPTGSETVWEPSEFFNDKANSEFAAFAAKHPNVALVSTPLAKFEPLPDGVGKNRFDLAILNLNYHDLYVDHSSRGIPQVEPRQWLKSLYVMIKPGGSVGVIDHIANPGDTRATANALHRIDPNTLKADFESVGFVLAGTSDLLRNPRDNHALKVFDPAIRGNTDRVVFRFRKPA